MDYDTSSLWERILGASYNEQDWYDIVGKEDVGTEQQPSSSTQFNIVINHHPTQEENEESVVFNEHNTSSYYKYDSNNDGENDNGPPRISFLMLWIIAVIVLIGATFLCIIMVRLRRHQTRRRRVIHVLPMTEEDTESTIMKLDEEKKRRRRQLKEYFALNNLCMTLQEDNIQDTSPRDIEVGVVDDNLDEKAIEKSNRPCSHQLDCSYEDKPSNSIVESKYEGDDGSSMMMVMSECDERVVVLPQPSESSSYAIPIICAICLDTYKIGESIAWSCNPDCQHAFHRDCIVDYLVQLKKESGTPCPSCRQPFVIPREKKQEEDIVPNNNNDEETS